MGIALLPRGGWRSNKRWEKIEKVLKAQNVDYDFVQSENQKSVERLIKMFVNNGYKTIVVVGGDSALNDAVNCLMQMNTEEREQVALGVIPNGLMNDFAHFWGFSDSDIENTVASLKARRIRKIDLGCIRYTNKKGGEMQTLFPQLHQYRIDCCHHEPEKENSSHVWLPYAVVPVFFHPDDLPASGL